MKYALPWCNQIKQCGRLASWLIPVLWSVQVTAQSLSTEPLAITAVCAGAQLDVTGIRSAPSASYGIELSSDGTTYVEIPSVSVSASGRYEITYRATVPAGTAAGSTYRVRFIAKSPDIKGSPSTSVLTVKASPASPTVKDIQLDCQRRTGNDIYTYIYLGINAGATASLYNSNLSLNTGGSFGGSNPANSYFSLGKPVAGSDDGYKYPISETTYFVTQTVNGCESSTAKTVVRTLYTPGGGPNPVNRFNENFGRLSYCQGDKSYPLNVNGHSAPPENYQTQYALEGASPALTTTPPIPDTSVPGSQTYKLSLVPIDSEKGCPSPANPNGPYLVVTVNARPGKPAVSAATLTVCQSQAASPLSATTSVTNASLVWYGTDATGGTGTATPPQPPMGRVGTYKYYVAQKLGDCESERAEIVVEVKPAPATPDVQSVAVCQNSPAPIIKVSGQNLLWYAAATGGTGSATTPVVSTSQTGQTTYYVSQSTNGCESDRSMFTVTVNSTPGVPAVASAAITYCQNAAATSLIATGNGLAWYRESSAGTSVGSTVTPDTKTAGLFTYYVSQSNNGCEGPRSSVTVTVVAPPSAPVIASTVSFCQNATAPVLTAAGTELKWYDQSGKSSDMAPVLSNNAPGTVSYFVTQLANGCESPRAEIRVTTNPTPGAPGTSALAVCQNTAAPTVVADGQNLRWYTAQTGGTSADAAPTINTGQVGQTNYYVSQSQNGCESARATLTITIKALPAAPTVTSKAICQFAPSETVSALGQNLAWYNTDGNRFGSAPTISTDKGASFTVLVTQTVNGCESAKATLSVTVQATPLPAVNKATVELCQGATAQALDATGTGLKWTDPTGAVTTTAPVPPTLNATKNPDGDVFYVTQTLNGCESSKAAIRVFVQTPPTVAILGTATTNLGVEVPLKLTFTGVGPYQYKLTNGISGTTTKDTTITVLPDRTTIYQVTEVSNKCGTGLPGNGASATITVLVPTIQTQAFTSATLCAGTGLTTNFTTSGTFNQGSVFKLQLAKVETDTTKIVFADLVNSQATNGSISGTIPGTTPAGTYWVRVLATNPRIPIKGTNSPTLLTVRSTPVATLTGNQSIFVGQPASLSVVFSGDAPWVFAYRDSTGAGLGMVKSVTATTNPYTLEVRPSKTTSYGLTSVSNGCGTGTLAARMVVITVNQLLGIEDQLLADAVDVYPVPATTTLMVRIRGLSATQTALLELVDQAGHSTHRQETRQATTTLSLTQQAAGTYILRIRVGDRTASKRILKL